MSCRLYNKEGDTIDSRELAKRLARADVVLFGELHGCAPIHRLQLQVTKELYALAEGDLILGAEMFEADNQLILDEYLAGLIRHRHLIGEAKVPQGYESDYRPLVDFAREQGIPFIASNIPRRYANLVAREGLGALERLPEEARRFMAPWPIAVDLETPGYREMLGMRMGHGMPMAPQNLVAAQAVKDATMAHFILKNRAPGRVLLHFNGDYHSRRYGGIYWYLRRAVGDIRVATVSTVATESLEFLEGYEELGDFVIAVPAV